jgi:hypothetical protein
MQLAGSCKAMTIGERDNTFSISCDECKMDKVDYSTLGAWNGSDCGGS